MTGVGASRMRVVTSAGEKFVSVADMVTALRGMAASVPDGPARKSLSNVAETFASMLGATELLPASGGDLTTEPCPGCGRMVCRLARHGSDRPIVLTAKPTPYGRWLIVSPMTGPPLAVEYDRRRPGAQDWARYREHQCAAQAVPA